MLRPIAIISFILLLSGCDNHDPQVTRRPMDSSDFFSDGSASRIPPLGTVRREEEIRLGKNGYPTDMELNRETLKEGRDLFEKQCAVCHGLSGKGDGIVTRRGLRPPPSLLIPHHLEMTPFELVQVMTKGKGRMPSHVRRLDLKERYKVAAYIKALQLSRKIEFKRLSQKDQGEIHAD